MYYWGLVSQAEWTDEAGRPKLAALGALNHGLETAALPSKVSEMAGRFSAPFMSLLARRERIELMREEILAHRVGWLL